MSPSLFGQRGLFFEEFIPGQEIITAGRTITEADVVNFAGLSVILTKFMSMLPSAKQHL